MEEGMKKLHVVLTDLWHRLRYPLSAAVLMSMLFAPGGFTTTAHAVAGDPDPSFNSTGIVITTTGVSDSAYFGTLQADGKIVCVGNLFVGRYNTDGSLDTSFNTTGKIITTHGSNSVAIQPVDHKIMVVGSDSSNGYISFTLARFNTDGTPDTGFGTAGRVTMNMPPAYMSEANSVAVQSDGQIVIAGTNRSGPATGSFTLARFNKLDGQLDATFSPNGINQYHNYPGALVTAIGTSDDEAKSVAIQSDGKVVAAGFSFNGTHNVFALARYNTNGSLDTTFNPNSANGPFPGVVTTTIGSVDDEIRSVAIQPDGKIVAAGISNNGSQKVFALVRYNIDGSRDTGFGSSGIVTTAIGQLDDEINSVAIQPDGKIVAAGSYEAELTGPAPFYQTNWAQAVLFTLIRYNTNGTRDASFGTNGLVTAAIGAWDFGGGVMGSWTKANSVAIQPDGKIVATGYAQTSGSFSIPLALAMARYRGDRVTYNGNGSTGGFAPTDSTNYTAGAHVIAAPNSGSLVRSGYVFAGWNTAADGSGTSYPGDGTGSFSMPAADVALYARWTASSVRIKETLTGYGDIQTAYASTQSGQTIQAQAVNYAEVLTFARNIVVVLDGGYDNGFTSNSGFTTVSSLTINSGKVTIKDVKIK
jgi:uncharacterized delta-60 repeat protein/uncharacterized repeat protein (TIGR02543 family)